MTRPTRAEMLAMAEEAECVAALSAATADRIATDPDNAPQAKAVAAFARRHSAKCREEAEALRDGRLPGEDA